MNAKEKTKNQVPKMNHWVGKSIMERNDQVPILSAEYLFVFYLQQTQSGVNILLQKKFFQKLNISLYITSIVVSRMRKIIHLPSSPSGSK